MISYTFYVMQSVDLPFATLTYKAPIVRIAFKDRVDIGLYEIRELVQTCEKLSGFRPYFIFADARERVSITPLGIKSAANPKEAPLHRGTAVLVNSFFLEKAANIFGKMVRPPFPYKVFTDHTRPIPWLYSLQEHNFGEGVSKQAC